jgi:hypothetical protein
VSQKRVKDIAASVRQRLLDRSRERGEDFQLTLVYYALERLLYRLSRSALGGRFVLKGAMLFSVWSDTPHRATRDLDLLGRGSNDVATLVKEFQQICKTPVEDDGLIFLSESITSEEIRDGEEYEGVRLSFEARLGVARIPIQVDIGFGDVVLPKPVSLKYPTLLDFPAPRLLAYPRETVIAEKFQSMVELGIANSRMKDFFDLFTLARQFEFEGAGLSHAIRGTFERRRTPLPTSPPLCLTAEFFDNRDKQAQWKGFLKRAGLDLKGVTMADVIRFLEAFLVPPTIAASKAEPFEQHWLAGGPWQPARKRRRA